MATKSILLAVCDPPVLAELTNALDPSWEAISVSTEAEAQEQLEQRSFDALLVDFNLGSPDASELVNQASEKHHQTIPFLLAYEADLALVAAKVLGSPHILPKPIEPASLKSRIENALQEQDSKQSGSEPATAPSETPKIPAIYTELLKALEAPGITNEQIGEMIGQDAKLTAEVLKLSNSSYLHWPGTIARPAEAVESLGLETVKALVMALQFLAEHSRLKPGYLSLDRIWQHSVNVGLIARDLTLFETKDRALASQALTAGLLHDLGKVVLATNFEDLYGRVHSLARKQPVAIWEIEKEMFGATHGEIGACLVGMWNMPITIVDAAALHHEPPLGEHEQMSPLAAVHIANVLEHELRRGDQEMMVAPIINTTFLNQLGLLQRLPIWRAAFANPRSSVNPEPEVKSTETDKPRSTGFSATPRSQAANRPPGLVTLKPSVSRCQPSRKDRTPGWRRTGLRRSWVYAGAVGIVLLLTLWVRLQSEPDQVDQIYARTSAAQNEAVPVVSSIPSPEPDLVAARAVEPPVASSEETPTAPAQPVPAEPVPDPTPSLPAPKPVAAATADKPSVANVQAPSPAPETQPIPEFHLKGIIFSVRPSAIINAQTVRVGDKVEGATVVEIWRNSVTLQINGLRKTYELK